MAKNNIDKTISKLSETPCQEFVLEHVSRLSHGKHNTGNMILQGDNLGALKLLEANYTEKVRCIYIDPPYNNKEQYNHYNDSLSHEKWIEEITTRLRYLSRFLRKDGSLWISIDDREVHYLKVAADRILGRENFITTIVWQQRTTRENRKVFSNNHEYLLVYARNAAAFKATRNSLNHPNTAEIQSRYKNPDNDPRGSWQSISANVQAGHATKSQFYTLIAPNGRKHTPPNGRCWVYNKEKMQKEIAKNNIWFGRDGNGVPRIKRFLSQALFEMTPETLWFASDVGTNNEAKKHLLQLFPNHPVFDTPKPEQLLYRILEIATEPNDIVLDAYLGSGTTCAVAHKMKRRYIGIEKGSQAETLCVNRLKQVIEGEQGGISSQVNWIGGGGFDFYALKCKHQHK